LHRITGFTVVYNSKHTHTITSETSRKGIIKIRAEINDIETKKQTKTKQTKNKKQNPKKQK